MASQELWCAWRQLRRIVLRRGFAPLATSAKNMGKARQSKVRRKKLKIFLLKCFLHVFCNRVIICITSRRAGLNVSFKSHAGRRVPRTHVYRVVPRVFRRVQRKENTGTYNKNITSNNTIMYKSNSVAMSRCLTRYPV